jgi:hypothetical protein
LEGVLCVMLVVQNSKTEAEHHLPVTADQHRVSHFITVRDETIQQFPIRQIRGIPYGGQPSDVPQNRIAVRRYASTSLHDTFLSDAKRQNYFFGRHGERPRSRMISVFEPSHCRRMVKRWPPVRTVIQSNCGT